MVVVVVVVVVMVVVFFRLRMRVRGFRGRLAEWFRAWFFVLLFWLINFGLDLAGVNCTLWAKNQPAVVQRVETL